MCVRILLAEAFDYAVDDVDLVGLRYLWKSWHTDDVAGNRHDHLGTGVDDDVLDGKAESFRRALELRGLGEGVLSLGEADREVSESHLFCCSNLLSGNCRISYA